MSGIYDLCSDMGTGNDIHPTAIIHDNVTIGNNNKIGAFAVIGAPGEILSKPEHKYRGRVIIGDHNIINSHVTIDQPFDATQTIIGDHNFIMRHCHIGHDAIIQDNCIFRTGTMIGGHCIIQSHCNTGLNSAVRPRCVLGQSAFIGMGAIVLKNVLPFHMVVGNPAAFLRINQVQMKERSMQHNDVDDITEEFTKHYPGAAI